MVVVVIVVVIVTVVVVVIVVVLTVVSAVIVDVVVVSVSVIVGFSHQAYGCLLFVVGRNDSRNNNGHNGYSYYKNQQL